MTFILGRAGHVAGIINPPGPRAYGHYVGPEPGRMSAEDWLAAASAQEDSWWKTWDDWVVRHAGGEAPAREPGAGRLPALEAAPGSYVKRSLA